MGIGKKVDMGLQKTPSFLDLNGGTLLAMLEMSDSLTHSYKALESKLTSAENQVESHGHLLREYSEDIKKLQVKCEEQHEAIIKIETECGHLRNENSQLTEEVAFRDQDIKKLMDKCKDLKKERESKEMYAKDLIARNDVSVKALHKQIEDYKL